MKHEFTPVQTAIESGVTLSHLYQLLRQRLVQSRRVDGRYLIPRSEVMRLKKSARSRAKGSARQAKPQQSSAASVSPNAEARP
jgi:hypothetical protein